jgi:hypothetical protein
VGIFLVFLFLVLVGLPAILDALSFCGYSKLVGLGMISHSRKHKFFLLVHVLNDDVFL